VVVDLAVEGDYEAAVCRNHRLVTGGREIQYREAAMRRARSPRLQRQPRPLHHPGLDAVRRSAITRARARGSFGEPSEQRTPATPHIRSPDAAPQDVPTYQHTARLPTIHKSPPTRVMSAISDRLSQSGCAMPAPQTQSLLRPLVPDIAFPPASKNAYVENQS
jgi:hypothetical protein